MILTSDDPVIRALQRQVDNPAAVRATQAHRDSFVDLLLALAGSEDDEPVPLPPAHMIPRDLGRRSAI